METQYIIEKGRSLCGKDIILGFRVIAKENEEEVGIYEIPFDKSGEITHGYINSKLNNQKIPRTLINMAVKEISRISSQEKRTITHKGFLINQRSFRLSPIYEELGYKKTEHESCWVLSKTYYPSKY